MSHWEAAGKSDEWYTPAWIFDALMCRFDCDVAAPVGGSGCHVPANKFVAFKSLERSWDGFGFIWMNPPFGPRNAIEPWLAKFCNHQNGIALTPDRTSAPWFQKWASQVPRLLFLPKVRFVRPDGTEGKSPSCGTVLWGTGKQAINALETARGYGLMMEPA